MNFNEDYNIEKDKFQKHDISEKEKFFLEAIFYCISNIYNSYVSLRNELYDNKNEKVIFYVINFIDNAHRLSCIIRKSPSSIEKKKVYKIFSKLDCFKEIRNNFQHYDNEVSDLIKNVQPLFGHISWIKLINDTDFDIHLFLPGTIWKFKNLKAVNPCNKELRNTIDQITFFFKSEEINLSDYFYELYNLSLFLNKIIEEKWKPFVCNK